MRKNQITTSALLLLPTLALVSGESFCFNQMSKFSPTNELEYKLDSDKLLGVSVRILFRSPTLLKIWRSGDYRHI